MKEVGGLKIPVNNSQVSNSLWRNVYRNSGNVTHKLMAPSVDDPSQEEWVHAFDLRHSYTIRCFGSEELRDYLSEQFVLWMGHGLVVQKRTYLRCMPKSRRKEGIQAQIDHFG